MPRLSRLAKLWVLAIALACAALAWPMHLAQHASEPLFAGAVAGVDIPGIAGDAQDDGDETRRGTAEKGHPCAWCHAHGAEQVAGGPPEALRFHAEASPPPPTLNAGRPAGYSPLAAHPRGPPTA